MRRTFGGGARGVVLRSVLALMLVLAWLLALWPATGHAGQVLMTGWWWRAQTADLPVILPPPPHVPEGGVAIGNTVDGATAVAAFRYELYDGESQPVLTLRVAGDAGGETASIAACHAGSAWFGAQAGPWDEKPTAACDEGSVQGVRADDGGSWTFALEPLLVDDRLDVVLVPEAGSPPFELSFERITDDSVAVTEAPAGGSFSDPSDFGWFDPGGFGSGAEAGGFDDSTFFAPPPGSATTRPFAPNLTDEEQELRPEAPVARRPSLLGRQPIRRAVDTTTDPRPLAVLVLAGAVVAGSILLREPIPRPRLLGPLSAAGPGRPGSPTAPAGQPEVGGLGRFARPRTGEPPRLF